VPFTDRDSLAALMVDPAVLLASLRLS
jgi:hypothetical protein